MLVQRVTIIQKLQRPLATVQRHSNACAAFLVALTLLVCFLPGLLPQRAYSVCRNHIPLLMTPVLVIIVVLQLLLR